MRICAVCECIKGSIVLLVMINCYSYYIYVFLYEVRAISRCSIRTAQGAFCCANARQIGVCYLAESALGGADCGSIRAAK